MGRKLDQMKLGESSEKLHYVVNPHGLQRRQAQPGLASSSHCSASVSELMIGLASEADRLCDDDGDSEAAEQRQVRVERTKDEEGGGKVADRSFNRSID